VVKQPERRNLLLVPLLTHCDYRSNYSDYHKSVWNWNISKIMLDKAVWQAHFVGCHFPTRCFLLFFESQCVIKLLFFLGFRKCSAAFLRKNSSAIIISNFQHFTTFGNSLNSIISNVHIILYWQDLVFASN
jgi:hypothetical protein